MATKKSKKSNKILLTGIILGLIAGIISLILGNINFLQRAELKTLDARYKYRPQIKTSELVGYIDYDDASIDLFGFWPWMRNRQVALVDALKFYNTSAAGYDVFFTEKSNTVFYPELLTNVIISPLQYYRQHLIETNSPLNYNQPGIDKVVYKNLMKETLSNSFKDYDLYFEKSLRDAGMIYLAQFMVLPSEDVAILSYDDMKKEIIRKYDDFTPEKKIAIEQIKTNGISDTAPQFKNIYRANIFKAYSLIQFSCKIMNLQRQPPAWVLRRLSRILITQSVCFRRSFIITTKFIRR